MFKKKIYISDKVEPYVDKPVASLFTCHLEHVDGNLVCLVHLGLEIINKLCYNSKKNYVMLCSCTEKTAFETLFGCNEELDPLLRCVSNWHHPVQGR